MNDEADGSSVSAPDGGTRLSRQARLAITVIGSLAVIALVALAVVVAMGPNGESSRSSDELVVAGLREQEAGNLDSAEKLYLAALDIEPDNALALYNLGFAKQSRQQSDEAVDLYRRALAADSEMFLAQLNLAWALRDLGRVAEAVAELTELRDRRPDDALIVFNLGQMLIAAGDVDEGSELVREAIELDESLLVSG